MCPCGPFARATARCPTRSSRPPASGCPPGRMRFVAISRPTDTALTRGCDAPSMGELFGELGDGEAAGQAGGLDAGDLYEIRVYGVAFDQEILEGAVRPVQLWPD